MANTPDNRRIGGIALDTIQRGHMIRLSNISPGTEPDYMDHELGAKVLIGKTSVRAREIFVQVAQASMRRTSAPLSEILPEIRGISEGTNIQSGEYPIFICSLQEQGGYIDTTGATRLLVPELEEFVIDPAVASTNTTELDEIGPTSSHIQLWPERIGLWQQAIPENFPGFALYDHSRIQLMPPLDSI